MSDPDEDRLEELREEKLQELQDGQQQQAQEQAQARQEEAEAQKQAMLRKYLSDGARKRLNSVRMSKPEFAEQAEQQILALAQSGRLGEQIDEEQMKKLLKELKPESQSYDIQRR